MTIISSSFQSQFEIEAFVVPAMSSLINVVRYRDNDEKSKEIMELASNLLANISDALTRFNDPNNGNLANNKKCIEAIATEELIDNLLEMIFVGTNSPNYSALTMKTWDNILHILRYMCKFSPKICRQCVSNGLLNVLAGMLENFKPGVKFSLNALIGEPQSNLRCEDTSVTAILLLDAILPQKQLLSAEGKGTEAEQYATELEKEKNIFDQGSTMQLLVEGVFPKIVQIFEESVALSTKFYCVQDN